MDLKDAIIDLEFWADAKGYCVDFSKYGNDSVDFESKLISINTTRSTEIQLYTIARALKKYMEWCLDFNY